MPRYDSDCDDMDVESENYSPSPAPKAKKTVGVAKAALAPSNAGNLHAGKALEDIYQKKSQLEHILLRPDTYIGSTEKQQQTMWIHDGTKMQMSNVSFAPGLYKIFDEILVNAADNKVRDATMDTIKVEIDPAANTISVWNNGNGIPVEVHKEENVYIPELIFGHLLTSSNYDDNEKKVTGGRNGYGAKLANIFSTQFIVETCDGSRQKRYRQVFSKNMSNKEAPKVTPCKSTDNWTQVTFKPDLAKFGMDSLEEDTVALMRRRVYDLAGILGKGVKVFLNGSRLPIKTFQEYVDQYLGPKENGVPRIYEKFSDRWEVCISTTEGQFNQVSFVNSICTYKGGTHVNYILDQLTKALVEKINKKNKTANVKPFMVKNHVWIFLNCSIENPAFDSQTKENLTLRASSFGSKCELTQPFIDKVAKCGIVEHILSFASFKNNKELKKGDGAKRARLTGIPKLDDANDAGTRNSHLCTLILTEGDSAKSLAISGLSIVGRDHYGVFPLRGKLLNVREASAAQISANAEIQNIKQILGLQHGKVYEDAKSLRYGHLMIMTDQDHDGSHIKGLIMNFFHSFYPSLLKLPGFLVEFITPIVKATKGSQTKSFYTMPQYESWKDSLGGSSKGWKIKYYKGLGTSTSAEAKEYFAAIDRHRKQFVYNGAEDDEAIEMAFSKKKIEERKEWLAAFKPGTFLDMAEDELTYQDFVNKELILFSRADLERSIPSVMDGLKPGQRKILFACFKKKLHKEDVKVGNLAGYVSDNAAYHHGEASLAGTIVGMAQDFVGSNNVNLLYPAGQFGTRRQGGKDAASPRYIYTRLAALTRHLFNEQDDQLLTYLNEDGQKIEPEWYLPIIPTVLINGAEGIGTGWSTSVPNYNPKDIVANIRRLLNGESMEKMHPWYRGFAGTITDITKCKGGVEPDSRSYSCTGVINQTGDTTIEIVELPVRKWTQDYKEWLETLIKPEDKNEAPLLVDYKESHTDQKVHFTIEVQPNKMQECLAEGLISKFKLTAKFATSNMVLFDQEGKIRHYTSPEEIIREFYTVRLEYYEKRRQALIKVATADMVRLNNMVRFILSVINGSLKVSNRKKAEVLADLQSQGYARQNGTSKKVKASEGEEGEEEEEGEEGEGGDAVRGYNYLLSMPIWSLTLERVQKLQSEANHQAQIVEELTNTTNRQMWLRDLDAFVVAYDEWEQELADLEAKQVKQIKAGKGRAGAKGKAVKKAVKSKKARGDDSEEEDDVSEEDEDEDFEIEPKPKPAAKKVAAPPPKPAPAPKPSASVSVQSMIRAAPPPPPPPPKPAVSASVSVEPLSLAARLAGRLQLNSGPPAAPMAASSYDLEDEITSPVTKPKAKAAPKPKAAAPGDPKPKAIAKPAPKRRAKAASSDEEFEIEDESEIEDDDDDVYELDAMSPEVAHKGKKGRVGPSPAHMKKVASKTSAPAAAVKPKAPAPAPVPAAKKAPPAVPPKKKKVKDESEDGDDFEEDEEASDVGEVVVVDRAQRARRPAAAAKPKVSYVEINDDEDEEEDQDDDDDDDDDFEASDEDDD